MNNQDERDIFIPPNRIICLTLFLLAYPMFLMGYASHYHPDTLATAYIESLLLIWIVALFSTLWLTAMTSALVRRGNPKRAAKISMAVYQLLLGFSAVILLGQSINQVLLR